MPLSITLLVILDRNGNVLLRFPNLDYPETIDWSRNKLAIGDAAGNVLVYDLSFNSMKPSDHVIYKTITNITVRTSTETNNVRETITIAISS